MKFFVLKRKWLTGLACVAAALALVGLVNHPAIVGAAATTRQLPIYCVQRDQKVVAISFDAAWGDVIIRPLGRKGSSGRRQSSPCAC